MTDRYPILLQFAYCCYQRRNVNDITCNIHEIYGHPITTVYDINESDFAVYFSVMIAYLCDIHPGGIWYSGTIDKDPGGPIVSIHRRHIFFKKMALYPFPANFLQQTADVLSCKICMCLRKIRIVSFIPYFDMAACTLVRQKAVKNQGKKGITFIREGI